MFRNTLLLVGINIGNFKSMFTLSLMFLRVKDEYFRSCDKCLKSNLDNYYKSHGFLVISETILAEVLVTLGWTSCQESQNLSQLSSLESSLFFRLRLVMSSAFNWQCCLICLVLENDL